MNDKQKILVMVIVVSFIIFLITAFLFLSSSQGTHIFWDWRGQLGARYRGINWVGIFSLATSIGAMVGFFLFKDK